MSENLKQNVHYYEAHTSITPRLLVLCYVYKKIQLAYLQHPATSLLPLRHHR